MPIATRTVRAVRSPARARDPRRRLDRRPVDRARTWEEHETRLFQRALDPSARVLDLGANVGWYSVLAVLAGCEVHAFEPVPEIAAVYRRNLERAMSVGLGRAVLTRVRGGRRAGRARIALGRENFGDNRVLDAGGPRPTDMGTAGPSRSASSASTTSRPARPGS
jgi:hypothetical protein